VSCRKFYERIDPDARIIWGAQIDPDLTTWYDSPDRYSVKSPQIYGKSEAIKTTTGAQRYGIDFVK